MSNIKKINQNINASVEVRSLKKIQEKTGNLYESLYVITKRANQINQQVREELHHKLEEFASHNDNLEEVFENREQIEISRHYEKMPKPTIIALEEFMNDGVYIRRGDEDNTEA
ncbi:MAG: DNA-directed RNA polymerase subunit omega [Fimbriimonadaceae bacterium]|nr:DNA-directed RNA polymerase subunit omega [Chitinophagales bacterium]